MDLHILDCSQYVYAGSFSKVKVARGVRESDGEYMENSAPIGGVRFLIHQAAELAKNPNNVVIPVFDRPPVIKREMYYKTFGDEYGYKGTRPAKDPAIPIQKDFAFKIMESIGFPVQAIDNYEADDVIYTLVQMYKNDYETVYVHCNDSDLYFIVSDNVCMDTVGPKVGKYVTRTNYESVVSKDGCPYNVHHIRKLCAGDKSDNIPGVGNEWAARIDEIVMSDGGRYDRLGDLDLCRRYLRECVAKYPNQPGAQRLLSTFNILTPLLVPEYLINDIEPMIDKDKLRYFVHDFNPEYDHWGFENELLEYIDSYYK